ncbi:MAG: transposase [Chloroflexi bacterium]|nr:transposase [Chloroflexota bacterium]
MLVRLGDIPPLSVSRLNRRSHEVGEWLPCLVELLGEVFSTGEVYVVDSIPVPVCKRAPASWCKKVRGRAYCGYCSTKREKFFGWRLHLIYDVKGIPITFDLRPASEHDLTPTMNSLPTYPLASASLVIRAISLTLMSTPFSKPLVFDWSLSVAVT